MNSNQNITVQCGKPDDDFDVLKVICENEAQKLCKKIDYYSGQQYHSPVLDKRFS